MTSSYTQRHAACACITHNLITCTGSDLTVMENSSNVLSMWSHDRYSTVNKYIYRKINKQIYYIIVNKDSTYREWWAQELPMMVIKMLPIMDIECQKKKIFNSRFEPKSQSQVSNHSWYSLATVHNVFYFCGWKMPRSVSSTTSHWWYSDLMPYSTLVPEEPSLWFPDHTRQWLY